MIARLIRLIQSFKYAFKGLYYAFREEQNIKIHFVSAVLVVALAIILHVSRIEAMLLLFAISFVIAMELVNTVLERVMDIIKPRMHPYAKHVKDMLAAMVLVASGCAFVVGLIIFVPKILALF